LARATSTEMDLQRPTSASMLKSRKQSQAMSVLLSGPVARPLARSTQRAFERILPHQHWCSSDTVIQKVDTVTPRAAGAALGSQRRNPRRNHRQPAATEAKPQPNMGALAAALTAALEDMMPAVEAEDSNLSHATGDQGDERSALEGAALKGRASALLALLGVQAATDVQPVLSMNAVGESACRPQGARQAHTVWAASGKESSRRTHTTSAHAAMARRRKSPPPTLARVSPGQKSSRPPFKSCVHVPL